MCVVVVFVSVREGIHEEAGVVVLFQAPSLSAGQQNILLVLNMTTMIVSDFYPDVLLPLIPKANETAITGSVRK